MIAYLTKFDANKGFNQIIDFLNGSSIKYALTVNPNIYVSCIKQFWTTVAVKKVNDITRLQALVDKKKVAVTEATIRDVLRLDDAKGVECLPNEEIFAELPRMGYEKPFTKLTFYKAFFLSQWKFLIHTILQCMSAKRTSLNEFSSSMASAVICLSSGKGFSRVETPLFEGMIVEQQVAEGANEVHDEGVLAAGIVVEGDVSAANDEVPTAVEEPSIPSPTPPTPPPQPSQDIPSTSQIAQAREITKLKQRVMKLEKRNKLKVLKLKILKRVGSTQRIDTSDDTVMDDVSKQGGIIKNIDADEDVVLEDAKDVADDAKDEPAKIQEVVDVVTTTKIITKVVTAASTTITAADVPILAATTVAAPTLTVAPSRRTKGDEVIDHVHKKAKEDNAVKRYQALKRKPQTEAQARKNMMIYLINVAGFKMDYFKGMPYDDIRPIFEKHFDSNVAFLQKTKEQIDEEDNRALKRLNESQKEKAAKKQKMDEEVEELKRHLHILPNDDDDNNKPYYKIKRADGSHQLYLSFLSLLRNFDREELEALWRLVKEIFVTTKPKNFSGDFLLITLGAMFEKPDIHAQIWKNQRSVHGQAKVKSWKLLESCGVQIITFTTTQLIFLVEMKYSLTRLTLDQMLNNVRLEVEEESKVSLELLSFGVDTAEESQGKHAKYLVLLMKDLVLPSQVDVVD
nr:hypothetical protein [Tanacetum cinerariifolium]